jgi:very-short-patch-repair endonuclease
MKERSPQLHARHLRQNMNKAEVLLWLQLRRRKLKGLTFRRQYPIGPYFADFACPLFRLTVEVDGASHGTDEALAYDRNRRRYIESEGWREVRVSNGNIYTNMEGVLEAIASAATAVKPPAFRRE